MGLASTISSEMIGKIEVYAGGFGAEFESDAQAIIDRTYATGGAGACSEAIYRRPDAQWFRYASLLNPTELRDYEPFA